MLTIEDIAHRLAGINRWQGRVARLVRGAWEPAWLSVAEHSVIVHDIIYESSGACDFSRSALMHDAREAITGLDMPPELKRRCPGYVMAEDEAAEEIAAQFDVPRVLTDGDALKFYDQLVARAEESIAVPPRFRADPKLWGGIPVDQTVVARICFLPPPEAIDAFLSRWELYRYNHCPNCGNRFPWEEACQECVPFWRPGDDRGVPLKIPAAAGRVT